ncbi:MAG TPA: cold-shock protein [Candidatus Eisenbacteria bacterium]|nr:cold-shock protein [Candidatus Eisenbacteria bacterium]
MSNTGTVKWFDSAKGYGFIAGEDNTDVFVHHTSIQCEGYASLEEGERVSYDVEEDHKGAKAVNVVKL